jgi:hypothetical protein
MVAVVGWTSPAASRWTSSIHASAVPSVPNASDLERRCLVDGSVQRTRARYGCGRSGRGTRGRHVRLVEPYARQHGSGWSCLVGAGHGEDDAAVGGAEKLCRATCADQRFGVGAAHEDVEPAAGDDAAVDGARSRGDGGRTHASGDPCHLQAGPPLRSRGWWRGVGRAAGMDSPDIGVGERGGPGKAPVVVIWRVGGEACACQQRGTADGAIEPGGQSGTASPAPDHGRRRLRRRLPAGRYRGFPLAWTTRGAGATRLLMTRPKAVRTIFGQCSLSPVPWR